MLTASREPRQLAPVLFLALAAALRSDGGATAQEGQVVETALDCPSPAGNLVGDPVRRPRAVYLPPSYAGQPDRRYPAVYLLDGYQGSHRQWMAGGKEWNIRDVMDQLIRDGKVREMILVMPDATNRYGGSFYTNSVATGNWEDCLVTDLVAFVDAKYRTRPAAASRGIAGHSMGGYGALKLAMKHPDRFGAAYGLSSACLGWGDDLSVTSPAWGPTLAFQGLDDLKPDETVYLSQAYMALAAAWSPNPANRPFFADLPVTRRGADRQRVPEVEARWSANMPVNMVDQYRTNLKRLRGLAFDVGRRDQFTHIPPTNRAFAAALDRNGVKHTFEEYDGDHNDQVPHRNGRKRCPSSRASWSPGRSRRSSHRTGRGEWTGGTRSRVAAEPIVAPDPRRQDDVGGWGAPAAAAGGPFGPGGGSES
jgi:S-formylglutathione hydrolase FrmB